MVSPDRVLLKDQLELFDLLIACKQMTDVLLNCL